MFDILPIDRGVVLLVDETTGNLVTHYVKLREGSAQEGKEILLSSTILRRVFDTRNSLISRDVMEDSSLGMAASVRYGQIRSVICVPLIAHAQVHGILHLDSRDRINSSFSPKDLSLVKAISNQTAMAIENMILMREVETKARITEQLSRFLPPHVVEKMAERGGLIQRSGREMVGTLVFVDIRGFTNLSESIGPGEVVNMLNDYFERLVRVVFKYEGIVDKYIGDCLMAVFGTLDEEVDSEYRSVAAAMEFIDTISEMNEDRARRGKEPIKIGVGVNTGNLLAGFIGCAQRLEYTCIGDAVNTASRLCDAAAKDQVLISEDTYQRVKQWVKVEPVGPKKFKGKVNEVMTYQVLSIDPKD
ncbi:nucleotide cyclase [Chytriomyces sp. MP71]|nr:nucleotide cyclase [Chytriomyces sp. MP71]